MNIVVFGSTGMIGSRITAELQRRGHTVTGANRSGGVDVTDPAAVTEAVNGMGAAVCAISARSGDFTLSDVAHSLIEGLRHSDCRRVLIVGGASSLEVAPGVRLFDTPDFPEAYKPEAAQAAAALEIYREVSDLDWTYVSPAAEIAPGERTGAYRLGGDQLLIDPEGRSEISAEDYAIAIADLVDSGEHARERVTAAY
jgi:uncharacterized protein